MLPLHAHFMLLHLITGIETHLCCTCILYPAIGVAFEAAHRFLRSNLIAYDMVIVVVLFVLLHTHFFLFWLAACLTFWSNLFLVLNLALLHLK